MSNNNAREIKFRVWNKKLNIMSYAHDNDAREYFLHFSGGRAIRCYDGYSEKSIIWDTEWKSNYEIQQFTGIKDKNNKDIYEGDIITGNFDFGPAGYVKQTLPVHWHNTLGYQWNYWHLNTIEIIGNIFQHPELLINSQFPKQPYDFIYPNQLHLPQQ